MKRAIDIDSVFSPGGGLDAVLPSYSFRDGQLEMAELVSSALEDHAHAIIEAGTGTGKSFAYLVPAIISLEGDRSRRFVCATSTTTLQKQLYDKDIPLVQKALGTEIEAAILYGRQNYLCLRRFSEARNEKSAQEIIRNDGEIAFEEWVSETETGALQDIPDGVPSKMFFEYSSDEKDCLGYRCPYASSCFYYAARRKAQKARMLVTNHHLLLLDAKNRAEEAMDYEEDAVLPGYSVVIMDEAHHLESEATEVLSRIFSAARAERILDYLTRKEKRFGSASIIDFLSVEEKERGFGRRLKEEIAHLRTMLQKFNSLISSILVGFSDEEVLLTPQFYSTYSEAISQGEGPAAEMARIGGSITSAYSESPAESNIVHVELIKRYGITLMHLSDTLRDWMRFSAWDEEIPYAVKEPDGTASLHLAPMSTGPVLSRVLVSHMDSAIFSSATLSVSGSFDYFMKRSGLWEEKERVRSGIFLSPFEYRKSLMLLLPQDGAAFSNEQTESYTSYVSEAIRSAISASGGGALVLFTSKRMMKDVYIRLREELDDLMIQSDRIPKGRLLKAFRERRDSSLFAVSSFWEGIDAPGDTLRLVIIVKLPFTVPSTPIVKARSEALDRKGGSSFMEMIVPEATLRLKQGLGRLIRTETDKGVVLILDGRILRKGYGRVMISSLPECYIPDDTMLSNIGDKIERFLY